ncbi:heat shock protein 70 family [Xylaria sp. FL1042]|nr:heat shock protein 70 family [Xylaria sp. FL1042]
MKPTRPGLIGSIGTLLLLIIGLLLFYPHAPSSDTRSTERNPTIAIGIVSVLMGRETCETNECNIQGPRELPDKNGNKFIPSCVSFTKDGFLIGDAARVWGIANPEATICNPKALLGKSWSDPDVQTLIKDLPYEVLSGHQDKPIIKVNVGGKGKSYTPEEVTSLIIGELKRMAEVTMGNNKTVTAAVMTVPMYYNDQQRQAIRDAARLAGLDVLRTQNESIAISVAYDMELGDDERNFIVVDIGDTLDVSVLNVDVGVLEVLATSHHDVGGNLFNRQIVNHLIETWKEKTGIDLAANPSSIRKLNLEVEKAKIARSSNETAIVDLRSIESTFVETLPNSEFEDVAEYLSMATMGAIRRNLQEAKLKFAEIDDIIITGGSGNIPKIHETVSRVFPHKTLYHGLGGDAVVIGAARTAALLSQPEDNHCGLRFTDSTPFDLGIETVDGFMATVVPRTFIPHRKSQNFTTAIDGQSTMLIRVLQGQRVLAADNLVIGEFELPLTPGPAGTPRVEVTFTVGLIH